MIAFRYLALFVLLLLPLTAMADTKKTVIEMLYMPTFKGGVFTSFLTYRF
jgi:hypothetical protein